MSRPKKTLSEDEINTGRAIGRRSALAIIGASFAAAGVLGTSESAEAQCNDSDSGSCADPAGSGRHCGPPSGCSDSDSGDCADPSGRGTRC